MIYFAFSVTKKIVEKTTGKSSQQVQRSIGKYSGILLFQRTKLKVKLMRHLMT